MTLKFTRLTQSPRLSIVALLVLIAAFINACGTTQQKVSETNAKIYKLPTPAEAPDTIEHTLAEDAAAAVQTESVDIAPLADTDIIEASDSMQIAPQYSTDLPTPPVGDVDIDIIKDNYQVLAPKSLYFQDTTLYGRIRQGLALRSDYSHERVLKYVNYYARYPNLIVKSLERSRPFLHHIVEQVERNGMPMEVALLPIIESNFKINALSNKRAMGVWQFIPTTGKMFGLKRTSAYEGRRDVIAATDAALQFFSVLIEQNQGDWLKAFASYNAGYGAIQKAERRFFKKQAKLGDSVITDNTPSYWEMRLPKETMNYLPKLLAVATIIENPAAFGMELPDIPNKPVIDVVNLRHSVDLIMVAKHLQLNTSLVKNLNPGFKRMVTPLDGKYKLVLPIQHAKKFRQLLAQNHKLFKPKTHFYTIKRGDTLSHIAEKFSVSVRAIRYVNNMGNRSTIFPNQTIRIPLNGLNKKQLERLKKDALEKSTKSNRQQVASKPLPLPAPTVGEGEEGRKMFFYLVREGDSMWTIAKNFNVPWKSLLEWNQHINEGDILRLNQKIYLQLTTQEASKLSTSSTDAKNHKTIIHEVRKNDSLWSISQKYAVTVNDIINWNKLPNSKILAGDKLVIKVSAS